MMRVLRWDLRQSGDGFPALVERLRPYLGREKLMGDAGADEVIEMTGTREHTDWLQLYHCVASVATMFEVKPTAAVRR